MLKRSSHLKVSTLVMNDEFPHDSRVEFDEDEVVRLLRANPMQRLEKMDANVTLKGGALTFDHLQEKEFSCKKRKDPLGGAMHRSRLP